MMLQREDSQAIQIEKPTSTRCGFFGACIHCHLRHVELSIVPACLRKLALLAPDLEVGGFTLSALMRPMEEP
eukprot:2129338-Amphidinium_carterae.1